MARFSDRYRFTVSRGRRKFNLDAVGCPVSIASRCVTFMACSNPSTFSPRRPGLATDPLPSEIEEPVSLSEGRASINEEVLVEALEPSLPVEKSEVISLFVACGCSG